MSAEPDRAALRRGIDERLEPVSRVLATHAGGIRLVDVDAHGTARLRFTGMCAGCALRPLTTAAVVAPALSDVPGVTRLDVAGARISVQAQERVAAARRRCGS